MELWQVILLGYKTFHNLDNMCKIMKKLPKCSVENLFLEAKCSSNKQLTKHMLLMFISGTFLIFKTLFAERVYVISGVFYG